MKSDLIWLANDPAGNPDNWSSGLGLGLAIGLPLLCLGAALALVLWVMGHKDTRWTMGDEEEE